MPHSSVHVSPGLAQFFHIISGMPWPESDEGKLRDVRDDYQALAEDLPKLSGYILDAVQNCDKRLEGEAAQAFRKEWGRFVNTDEANDPLRKAGELCTQLAELAGKVANTVEYTKWMAIGQLVQLLFEIALAIAWSVFTGGGSLVALEFKKLLTRQFLLWLVKKLLTLIAMHTFGGIVGGLMLDAIIQGIQFQHGDRHEWDKDLTKQAAIFGAISGAIGGPLSLLGMGLGKLLGPRLSKLFVESALKDVIKGLTGGVGKDLAGGVAGGALKGIGKELGEGAAAGALKGIGKDLGEGVAGGALKGAGKEAGEGFGRLLGNEAAERFANGITTLLKENSQYLAKGFKGGRKVGAAMGQKFVRQLGELFEKELGQEIGEQLARDMGEQIGKQFVQHSLKTVAKESSQEALKEALENLAKDSGKVALTPELKLLVEKMPELAGGINKMDKMFHLGAVLGSQFESGINQYLTEGIYNTIYNGEWSASGMSFVGGFMMAGMRHMIMGLASPLTLRYADYVRGLESSRITEENGGFYGPTDIRTFLSVISNMGGHAAPFPVPRPGHIDQIGGTRLSGGDGASIKSDGVSIRTEGTGSLSGSTLLDSGSHHPEENGDGVLADPAGKSSFHSSVDGGWDPKAPVRPVETQSRGDERNAASGPPKPPAASGGQGERDTVVPPPVPRKTDGGAENTTTTGGGGRNADGGAKAGNGGERGSTATASADANGQSGAVKPQAQPQAQPKPDPSRRTTVVDEHGEAPLHESTTTRTGGTVNGTQPQPQEGGSHRSPAASPPPPPIRTSAGGPGDGAVPATPNRPDPNHTDPNRPDPNHSDPNHSDPNLPDPKTPQGPGPDPQVPPPPATPPRDPKPNGPGPDPHTPDTPPSSSATSAGHLYHQVDAPEHAKAPAGDERRTAWRDKQQSLADDHDARLAEAERQEADRRAIEDRLTEGAALLPRELRALVTPDSPVWRRAAETMREDLEARPHEREEILAGATDRLELTGARELALTFAVGRFERLLADRGLGPEHSGDHTLTGIRRDASEKFRADAEQDIAQLFTARTDLTPERNALAARALERRLREAGRELDVRQARAQALEQVDRVVDDAHDRWSADELSDRDRALLEAAGLTGDVRLTPEVRDQLAEALRERLADLHGGDEGPSPRIEEEGGEDLAPVDPTRLDRTRLEADFQEALERHRAGLSHDFTVQAVREAGLKRSADAVDDAAAAWKDTAADQFGPEALRELGLADGPSARAVAAARADLARRADRLVAEHTAADRDPAHLKAELDKLTSRAEANRLLALHGAREEALRAAEDSARTHVPRDLGGPESATEHAPEHATEHDGDAAASVEMALGPVRGTRTDRTEPSATDAARRVREGYTERVRAAFEETFRALLRDPGADHRAELPEQVARWRAERDRLTEGLAEHVAFERAVLPARERAAAGYDRLAEDRRVPEAEIRKLKGEYGDDFFDAYREHWAPEDLDGERWRGHEATHENVFGRRPEPTPEPSREPANESSHEPANESSREPEPTPVPEEKPTQDTPSGPLTRPTDTGSDTPDTPDTAPRTPAAAPPAQPPAVPPTAVPPADPRPLLPASAWADIRTLAPSARMDTVRFDARVRGQDNPGAIAGPKVREQYENRVRRPGGLPRSQRSLGDLHGADTAITYDVRRFEAQPDHWVTEFTLNLHLKGPDGKPLPEAAATRVLDRARAVVADRFNERHRLPGGDQVHLRLESAPKAAGAHQSITVLPGTGRSDQLHWYDGSAPGVLLHEVLHFLGLPDEYVEPAARPGDAFALRRRDRWAGENGVMGTAAHRDDFTVLPRHLQRIEEVLHSGPVLRDLTHGQYLTHQESEVRSPAAVHDEPTVGEHLSHGEPPAAPLPPVDPTAVDVARRHLGAASQNPVLFEYMGWLRNRGFTSKRDEEGMIKDREGPDYESLLLDVQRFLDHAQTLRPAGEEPGQPLSVYRAVKMDPQSRERESFTELLPASTSFSREFVQEWMSNGGGADNYGLFEIKVPLEHPMLALSFPPGHARTEHDPRPVNEAQSEVTLGPSRLSVTGRDDSGGYHVIKVDASPMTVDDIRGEVADWSSSMSIPEAFQRFTDFYTSESLLAAYPKDLGSQHRITETWSSDGLTKTVKIEYPHESLQGQYVQVEVRHEGESVSVTLRTTEDAVEGDEAPVRIRAAYSGKTIGEVFGSLRTRKLQENSSFESIELPFDWYAPELTEGNNLHEMVSAPLPAVDPFVVDLARQHLDAAKQDQALFEFMGRIKAGAFTSRRDDEGMLKVREGERYESLLVDVQRFLDHAQALNQAGTHPAGQSLSLFRAVKLDARSRERESFTELLPASTSFSREFVQEWMSNGGGADNYALFDIKAPLEHPMLALSFPPGHVRAEGDPDPVNENQSEVTLGPSRLSVTGRDDSGGYHVIKVDASPMTVDDIRSEVANWSSGMSIPDAFRRFTDFYTPESLRAAYSFDFNPQHSITESWSQDRRTKTVRIEHSHPDLNGQFAEATIRHEDDGSVSIRWGTSDDTEPREPMVFNADNIGNVSGGLRSQTLTENPSFESLDLPVDWYSPDYDWHEPEAAPAEDADHHLTDIDGNDFHQPAASPLPAADPLAVDLARQHLEAANQNQALFEFMGRIKAGAFTSRRDDEGMLRVREGERYDSLLHDVQTFLDHAQALRPAGEQSGQSGQSLSLFRAVRMDPQSRERESFTELLPASTSFSREFVQEWMSNGGGADNYALFDIKVPLEHPMLALSFPPGHARTEHDPQPVNEAQSEVTLGPSRLTVTGRDDSGGYHVIKVDAEPMTVDDIRSEVANWSSGTSMADAFRGFADFYSPASLRAAYPHDFNPQHRITETSSPDGLTRTVRIEHSHPDLNGQFTEVTIRHEGESVSILWRSSDDTEPREPMRYTAENIGEVSGSLRSQTLTENPSFESLDLPWEWYSPDYDWHDPEAASAEDADHHLTDLDGDDLHQPAAAPPLPAADPFVVDLARQHLDAAKQDQALFEFMGRIKAGAFTSRRDDEGMLKVREGERYESLLVDVQRFLDHARALRPAEEGSGRSLSLFRAVKLDAQSRERESFTELLPASTSFSREFVQEWMSNGGGADNYALFDIKVPLEHPMLALSFPPGHVRAEGDPDPVNENQSEVTLGPSRLSVTGRDDSGGYHVIKVDASPMTVDDIRGEVANWSSSMSIPDAFRRFTDFYTPESLRAAYPRDLTDFHRITEETSPDGRTKTIRIEHTHEQLAEQFAEVAIHHGGDGSVSIRWSTSEDTEPREPMVFNADNIGDVSGGLRSQKLTENPSFEMLDLPWDWFDYTAPMPEDIGQPLSAFGGGAKGWRIGEADMPQAERDALAHFPEQPGVFVVPVHTDEATGRPVWPNGPDGTLSAYQTAGVLARLRRAGIWNGTDTVQFVACNLGRGPGREFVDEVMLRLKELDLGPRALAATGPVYFAPRGEGGPGHLVVASDIGFTESGHPVMVGGDHWLEFQAVRDGDSGQIHVQVEERGAHRAPDGSFHDHPEGYGLVESIAPEHRNPQAVKYAEPTPEQAAAAVALSVDHLTAAPPDSPLRTFMGQIKNGVFTNLRNPEGRLFQREGTVTFDKMMGNLRTFYNHAERLRPPEGHPGAEGTVLLYRAVRMEPQTRQQESFTDVLPSSTTYDRAFAQGWMSNPDRYALFEIQVPLSHPMLALSFPPGHAAAHGHLDEVNTTQYEVTLGPSRLTVTGREEDGPFHVIRAEAEPMTLHDVQETIAGWVNETPVREVFDLFAVFYSEQALRAAFPENLRADFRVTERLSADGREKTVEITSTHPKLTGQNATVHLRLEEGENGNETLLLRTHNTEDAGWGDPPLEFQYTRETLHEVVNNLRAGTLDKIAPFDTINLPSGFLWTDPVPEAGEVGAPLSAFGGPGNGWWLGHPEPSAAERYALARFPAQDGVFTLAVHTDPDTGLPLPLGTDPETGEPVELTEDRLVGILAGLHQGGVWNGTDRLQLVSCNLGRAPGLEYTTEVMRQLGLADLGSSALVATGPVYFTPRVDGTDGPGHLVVASAVGFTADGHPAVVAGGHFLEVERPTAEGQAPVIVDRGAHLPAPVYPDRDRDRPEGYDSAAPGTLHPDREPEGALAFANKKKTTKTAPPETTKTASPETTESAPPETTNSAERIADVLSGGQRSAEAQEVAKQPEGTVAKGKERADEPKPVPAAEPDPDSVAAATVVLKDSLLQQLFTGTDKSLTYAVISLALKGDKSWETAAAVTNGHDESINDSRSLQAADRWAKENGLPTQRYDAEVKGLAKAFQQMKEWGFEQVPHPSGKPPEKAVSRQPGAGLPAQPEGVLTVLSSRGTCASCKSVVKDFQEAFPGVGAYVGYTIAAGQKSTLSNQPRTYHRGGKDVEGVIEYGWNDVARLNSTSAYVPKGKDIAFRYFPAKNDEAAWARRLEERAAEQEAAARRAAEEAARAAEANATSVVDQGIKPAPARQVTEFAKTYKGKPEDFVKELDKVMKKGIMAWKPSAEVQAALLLWYQKDPRPDLKGSTA